MFLELIATFVAGIAAAGLVMALRRLTGNRLARWLPPVAAGAAMIAFSIWSEYSWAGRTAGGLPDGVAVVDRVSETIAWKPWTFLAPQTTRLVALDRAGAQRNPDAPGVALFDVYLFERWRPTARRPQLIDCAGAARADVTEAALADPVAADWRVLGAGDPLIRAACDS
ncbi:hypothetical protein GE300_17925 [Rhodobacteraceae bacterium 2CG4]|uniref:Uncharacterized protein n=1 Tax=Halovulum marinum TaxID=2662447 RepID=A0A6L5Z5V5_9RHOB|nr:hypothetical protein [Halovulum marinum]MSU91460.1 hypothetical protein [Halovulum marinum]